MSEQTIPATGAEEVAWDLTDLYGGADDPALERDLKETGARANDLADRYKGRIAELDAGEMAGMLADYEAIVETIYTISGFAYLNWATNTEDPARGALRQKVTEHASRLEQTLVFLELEWADLPDEQAKALMADPALAGYRHWLEVNRQRRPYLLSEPEEKILAEKAVTGSSAWSRFFNETHSAARYEWQGQDVPLQTVLTLLYNPDRAIRQQAAEVITGGLAKLGRMSTYVFNTILADKASTDRLRGYPSWLTARNLSNEVDDASVEALVGAVTGRYDIVARYYRLKARLLDLDELYDYDRYAPLPAADRFYPWDEATTIVQNAYDAFHPRMAEIVGKFLDRSWIDAPVRPGKVGGAFSAGLTPSTHPYILLNYEAKPRDVMTLAHELGHGIHQYLSRGQGMLQAGTPLTTAETASVFGEMLVFQDILRREEDPATRLALLTSKLEDSFATVFRQIAMNRFEDAIHTARREEGELSTGQFNEHWLETQRAMFEGSVTLTDNYGLWWSYVHHFVNYPGYVYAYAFGELMVLALYARYEAAGPGFADGYLAMLSAGGSDWPHEIVKPLGIDLGDPDFWDNGLDILDELVSDAESLAAELA
jgi:oligoendopeptidase F